MSTELQDKVTVNLFLGCLINSEVKMHLNYSDLWKRERVIRSEEGERLEQIRFANKDYVGASLKEKQVTLERLEEFEAGVRKALARYCPELNVETVKLNVIPQLFIS